MLDEMLCQLVGQSWPRSDELLTRKSSIRLAQRERKELIARIDQAIRKNQQLHFENYLYAALLLDESYFLPEIQQQGMLRISRHSYESPLLTASIPFVLNEGGGLSHQVRDYLASVANLYTISSSIRDEYLALREWLSSEREQAIRGAVATVDCIYLQKATALWPSDPTLGSRDMRSHTAEDLADGFSAILAIYFQEFGNLRWNAPINSEKAATGFYLDQLVSGAHIVAFREWEFLVDRFSYRVKDSPTPSRYLVEAPSHEYLRAVELGHIFDLQQRYARYHQWHDKTVPSFLDLGQRYRDKFATFVDEPSPRYRFELPEPLLQQFSIYKVFTQEEQKFVTFSCRELHVTLDELLSFKVLEDVSFDDLFRFSRIVHLMYGVSAAALLPELVDRPEVVFNTLVPAFDSSTLNKLVGLVTDEGNVESLVSILTVKPSQHIDILYTPLIPAGKSILMPLHIFANSNIFRNPLVKSGKRFFADGTHEPLNEEIKASFLSAGAHAVSNVKFKWRQVVGEIDVAAHIANCLFVCECKHSLLPTGVHELRTSLDHIEKAAMQLDRIVECCKDDKFREYISKRIGVLLNADTQIIPAIFVSNRMFLGLRVHGYPVRGNQDFSSFISRGTITILDHEVRLWHDDMLTPNDLRRFFEDEAMVQPFWRSLESFESQFEFPQCVVVVPRLRLNAIKLAIAFNLHDLKGELLKEAREQGASVDDEGNFVDSTESN